MTSVEMAVMIQQARLILTRLAHPGGPLATNKVAALAKFLERKLQKPGGLSSINPDLVELAVKNAKETLKASTIYYVGPDGWKKLSGDDVGELHYKYYPVVPSSVEQEMAEVAAT